MILLICRLVRAQLVFFAGFDEYTGEPRWSHCVASAKGYHAFTIRRGEGERETEVITLDEPGRAAKRRLKAKTFTMVAPE